MGTDVSSKRITLGVKFPAIPSSYLANPYVDISEEETSAAWDQMELEPLKAAVTIEFSEPIRKKQSHWHHKIHADNGTIGEVHVVHIPKKKTAGAPENQM